MINYLALLAALSLSSVSGYYSIVGLAAIFSSAFNSVVIMGCALEAGKLITASWLYNNWNIAPLALKTYLTAAVIILMFVTSMGIFGFLSKAHIDQTVRLNSGATDDVKIVQTKIDFENTQIKDLDTQIAQIDAAIDKLTQRGQATASLRAADSQRQNRDKLVEKKQAHIEAIAKLNQQRIQKQSEVLKAQAEVGPVRYIAELMYENADNNQLEKAVRLVILILVAVFDPLAVMLLIAANVGLHSRKPLAPVLVPPAKPHEVFHIDDRIFHDQEIWASPKKAAPRTDSTTASTDSGVRIPGVATAT